MGNSAGGDSMSTTLPSGTPPTREERPADPRARIRRGAWLIVLTPGIVGLLVWGLLLFTWTIDETHFDRPSEELDALAAQVDRLPGVSQVQTERWVEAPAFATPTSWLSAVVDAAALPRLLRAACSTAHPEPLTWSLRVLTAADAEVALHATSDPARGAGGDRLCLDFGFDAKALVHELDRAAPGLAIQPMVLDDGGLALIALDEEAPGGFSRLLPLVEHAPDLIAAAGLDRNIQVEISSADLDVQLAPGESDAYLVLLTRLADDLAVRSFWSIPAGMGQDRVDKVQIVAPADQHTAIEDAVGASGLRIAGAPIGFIEP